MKHKLHKLSHRRLFRILVAVGVGILLIIFLLMHFIPKKVTQKQTNQPAQSAYDRLPTVAPQHKMKGMDMSQNLSVDVAFLPTELQITNNDNKDVHMCRMAINEGMVQRGYTVQQSILLSKKLTSIPYTDFMRYGVHFNPAKQKVVDLMVMCEDKKESGWKYFKNQ